MESGARCRVPGLATGSNAVGCDSWEDDLHLLAHDLTESLEHETATLTDPKLSTYRRELPIHTTQRPNGALPWRDMNRDLIFVGHGSNVSCLVGPPGLEPSLR
jgi:hypothetical protein